MTSKSQCPGYMSGPGSSQIDRFCNAKWYCCYLLTSLNPSCKGHTYIGFTTNPSRRLKQHNGLLPNGAKRTLRNRPWEMVVFVHGFSTKVAALQFEWGWQHPYQSKRIRDKVGRIKNIGHVYKIQAKIRFRSFFKMKCKPSYRFLFEMLQLAPWNRFPLSIHWLTESYHHLLEGCPPPPLHITARIGTLEDTSSLKDSSLSYRTNIGLTIDTCFEAQCLLCREEISDGRETLECFYEGCGMRCHMLCLAGWFLEKEEERTLLPTAGACPLCANKLTWAQLVQQVKNKKRGQTNCPPSPAARKRKLQASSSSRAMTETDCGVCEKTMP
jgi:structure-specific endonuclease subunit SLX1